MSRRTSRQESAPETRKPGFLERQLKEAVAEFATVADRITNLVSSEIVTELLRQRIDLSEETARKIRPLVRIHVGLLLTRVALENPDKLVDLYREATESR